MLDVFARKVHFTPHSARQTETAAFSVPPQASISRPVTDTASTTSSFHRLANPGRFLRFADAIYPWCLGAMILCLLLGLALALVFSPADYQQGDTVRIMYVHVPAAWMALFVYLNLALASASLLIWRHPLAGIAAEASAPIGAAFTFLALVTGSLWGKPMWGTWWEWDARLTSQLILLFLYVGVLALYYAFNDARTGAKAASILALVGVVNVPIIHFSVYWWNSLHQGATVTRFGETLMPASMKYPLYISILGFMLLTAALIVYRLRNEILKQELHRPWALAQLGVEKHHGV